MVGSISWLLWDNSGKEETINFLMVNFNTFKVSINTFPTLTDHIKHCVGNLFNIFSPTSSVDPSSSPYFYYCV